MAQGDIERDQPSIHLEAVFREPFPEQIAFFRRKLGNLIPTQRWTDVWKSAHDSGFMVAGAAKADLLTDLATAVDKALSEGGGIEAFRKDFDAIVAKHGWAYRGGRNWRTRIILNTNAATSYAAGRLAQLREAGFSMWIYRHTAGEMDPRPLHLAWNNLALPADSAWWKTHYPPGGWGCRCYVIGAHNETIARQLGGEKKTPPDDGINPKTHEPNGIDKGWGYMPGDTVSHTVETMAAQTRQWPYEIAKAYMQSIPSDVRDKLATAYRSLPSTADDTRRYAQAVIAGRPAARYRTLGLVTTNQSALIRQITGVDVSDFDFTLDPTGVEHVNIEHGPLQQEIARGQIAVTPTDYEVLPYIIDTGKIQPVGNSRIGRHQIKIIGRINDSVITTYWEVRARRKMLTLQTLWIGS